MFDLRSILAYPSVYRFFQNLVHRKKHIREYVDKYVKPKEGDTVLDIGCGPADILDFLPKVKYFGFDISSRYINEAKRKYGGCGTFFCKKFSQASVPTNLIFDIVIARNVLHHLNDDEVIQLFKLTKECLKPGGRMVTIDGCRLENEGLISKVILSLDRGRHVRHKDEYLNLARQIFNDVVCEVRNDLSNIPINGICISCIKN